MIDVQPYIDKLEVLKEWMASAIDGRGSAIIIHCEWLPRLSPDEILNFFFDTGCLIGEPNQGLHTTSEIIPFEQYYK